MNPIIRFITLSMFVALAFSATTLFSDPTSFTDNVSAVPHTNGVVVTVTGAGWVYGQPISFATARTQHAWTTLLKHAGITGIGIAGVSGGTCRTSPSSDLHYTSASLIGKAKIVSGSASNVSPCPADVVTLYTNSPGFYTTTPAAFSFTQAPLVDNEPVRWSFTTPDTQSNTRCYGVSVDLNDDTITAPPGLCSDDGVISTATSTVSFAFYLETTGSASACFQTDTQHALSVSCGTPTAVVLEKSGSIFSATVTVFVTMIALIFFN